MFRPLVKLMIFIFVTLTCITLVVDGMRSVSASNLTINPFSKILAVFLHTDINSLNQFICSIMPSLLSSTCIILINFPAWLIFGILAITFYILSYEPRKPFHKISYQEGEYI
ncbi:conserved exported protein of unknown function [Bartonella clarridgeiae 73]|uniref:Uncharacterized protein n=1 Tax=Bartonella clarridgeiae (strain CCUG 45776 / CIP 104772 / 73) TaxID=696125 RepID=E6YGB3_BARC7|nr:hypothetical protein [Bartonella clarridgeiae]WCR55492.1 MAG: hypothetical protein PG977_000885 [Bartonella clarridgeiae]CBI75901.1 conserved exported protein of unknown function [Bartonella clarridgeiae 73]